MGQALRKWKAKTIVSACCVCGDLRDDIDGNGSWVNCSTYLRHYGLRARDLTYSHTFCPFCFIQYRRMIGLDPSGIRPGGERRKTEES